MYVRDYRFMCFASHVCTKSTLSLAYDLLPCRDMVPDGFDQYLDLLSEAVSENVPSHLKTVCQDSYKDSAVALIKLCGRQKGCEHASTRGI